LPDALHEPRIEVYPVAEFEAISESAAKTIADLRQLTVDRPAAPERIPFLPAIDAGQVMRAQVAYLDFEGGTGVRFLTQYAQGRIPVNNHELFYTFQGLTDEGNAYVAAILPVSHPRLPPNQRAYQGDLDALVRNYDAYIARIEEQLSAQDASSFTPGLDQLDALIRSLEVGSRCPPVAPSAIEDTDGPYLGWGMYVNEDYGFIFRYPTTWTLKEEANYLNLCQGTLLFTIVYRRQGEDFAAHWTGMPAGELEDRGTMSTPGLEITRQALVYEGKVKVLVYGGEVGDLVFSVRLDDVGTMDYRTIDIPGTIQVQADQIVGSLTATPPMPPADRLPPGWVYRFGGALWLVDAGGWSRLVSRDPYATLSPDGRQLITHHPGDQEYWLRDRATGEEHNLARTPDRLACCYRWWPERPGILLFTSIPASSVGLGGTPSGAVAVVNVDGTGYEVLDAPPITWFTAVAPSPDGQTLAYREGKMGWLYHWDAGSEVFDPVERGLAEIRNPQLASPAWSPDGAQLAWVVKGKFGDDVLAKSAIVVFDLAAESARVLRRYTPEPKGFQPPAPAWSPDGRWLAFEAWSQDPDEDGLWVVQVDGSPEEQYHLGAGSDPIWSRDGRWLVFRRVEGGQDQIYVSKVGGTGSIPFTRMAGAHLVDWIEVAPGVQPVPTATPVPGSAEDGVVLPDRCRQALEGTSLYVNPIDGYCLRYPARFRVDDVYPPGVANLYGPPLDPYPPQMFAAGSTLLVKGPVGDQTLSQAVDAWLERRGGQPPIQREEGVLGGQPAEIVEYEGSWTRVRVAFALHGNKLYALSFFPDGEQFPQAAADVNALWETVIGTFAFLPPETGAAVGEMDDRIQAREALQSFFGLLHDGRYAEAVSYYGGDYELLRDWNPTIARDDPARLFEKGCTVNGLQCLPVKIIVGEQARSAGEVRFTVEFMADNGSTFARSRSATQFEYTVRKVEGRFLVQELPVYVP
jgi:hypothetical protein